MLPAVLRKLNEFKPAPSPTGIRLPTPSSGTLT
jgi:hypothetical protein